MCYFLVGYRSDIAHFYRQHDLKIVVIISNQSNSQVGVNVHGEKKENLETKDVHF